MKGQQNNMKIVTICLSIGLLISCTSEPLSVRYYLLHTPESNVSNITLATQPIKAKPIVVLQLLNVADYLRQSSLVMQVSQHELHYSRQDVWAEKLQSSFYKTLLQDLNAIGQRNYIAATSPNATFAMTTVSIQLEHFHATGASTVVSSGRYRVSVLDPETDKSKDRVTLSHTFFFESDLKQDGYAHAVEQLRTLIVSLAEKIEKDIAALPNN
jgi:uncharacterized lipoprotein YmbA